MARQETAVRFVVLHLTLSHMILMDSSEQSAVMPSQKDQDAVVCKSYKLQLVSVGWDAQMVQDETMLVKYEINAACTFAPGAVVEWRIATSSSCEFIQCKLDMCFIIVAF